MHESKLLRVLESKAMHNNIESDDSEYKDKENMDATRNDTENNDKFPRDEHQDSVEKDEEFGATANLKKDRSTSKSESQCYKSSEKSNNLVPTCRKWKRMHY